MSFSVLNFLVCLLGLATAVISATLPHAEKDKGHDSHRTFSSKDSPSNREYIGISEDLLQRFRLMAEYAAAAYCPGNNDSPGNQITCPAGNCPHVEAANATTMEEFRNTRITDDTGFLAIDNINRIIVLSFRGTSSRVNKLTDLKFIRTPTGWCKKCSVHLGFWEAWMEAKNMIMAKVKAAVTVHPDFRLVITGHSLGAAIATLAAGDIRRIDSHLLDITELPYVNATMLMLEEGYDEKALNKLHVTFPPGSVSSMAAEAVHGPVGEQDDWPSTTIDFEMEAV
ncbi:MAG: hypothetical protein Q9187_000630 [Circinaria calcarea]